MRVNDRLLVLHAPKTGGSFLRTVLDEMDLGFQTGADLGYDEHVSLKALPPDLIANRAVIGTVRDPWSWYVSWFMHGSHSGPAAPVLAPVADDPQAPTFLGTLPRMLAPAEYGVDLEAEIPHHPGEKPYAVMAAGRAGLCSWMFGHTYLRRGVDTTMMFTHRIQLALPSILTAVGYDGDALAQRVDLFGRPPLGARKYPPGGWEGFYEGSTYLIEAIEMFDRQWCQTAVAMDPDRRPTP